MAHVLTELKIVPKSDCSHAAELARELGLELQAKRYEKPLAENAFTPLSEDEITIWRTWCPTRYADESQSQTARPLRDYAFDSVPIEVMRHWKAIKDNYAFDRYEIWTTERTRASDPLLIGVLGTHLYLLARWGLESPESLPLMLMVKQYHDRKLTEHVPTHVWTLPWQDAEKKRRDNENWFVGWLCHYDRTFAACRRLLGLPVLKHRPSYD